MQYMENMWKLGKIGDTKLLTYINDKYGTCNMVLIILLLNPFMFFADTHRFDVFFADTRWLDKVL